ncbi:DUF6223 family protein [Streptomyces sp. NPDC020898]|uniref:DUF6223 family protein n=1 Tax=Streptomyces sp. NPDC020898 TaxID=3365101 RepID=UPI0037A12AA6
MSAVDALMVAAEGGAIGDGRTGANLALGVGLIGVALAWLTLTRLTNRPDPAKARTGALSAMAAGLIAAALATLHLATSNGGPGTGNGTMGAVVALPLALTALTLGRRALSHTRRPTRPADHLEPEREASA